MIYVFDSTVRIRECIKAWPARDLSIVANTARVPELRETDLILAHKTDFMPSLNSDEYAKSALLSEHVTTELSAHNNLVPRSPSDIIARFVKFRAKLSATATCGTPLLVIYSGDRATANVQRGIKEDICRFSLPSYPRERIHFWSSIGRSVTAEILKEKRDELSTQVANVSGPLSEGKGQPAGVVLRLIAEWIVLSNVSSSLLPALVAELICKADNKAMWKMVRLLPRNDLIVTDELQPFGHVLLSHQEKSDRDLARLCLESLPAKFKKRTKETLSTVKDSAPIRRL